MHSSEMASSTGTPTSSGAQTSAGTPTSGSPLVQLHPDAIRQITEEVRKSLMRELLDIGWSPNPETGISSRWSEGELILKPTSGQEKVVPLESFFRKLVLARERLRVLEQKINNHPKLEDPDRLELQKYLSQIYGSFTTFNILFEERSDWFVGQKGDR